MTTLPRSQRIRQRTLPARTLRAIRALGLDGLEIIFTFRLVYIFRAAELLAILAVGVTVHLGMWTAAVVTMLAALLAQLMIMERER